MKRLLIAIAAGLSLACAASCAQVTVTIDSRAVVKAIEMVKLGEMAVVTGSKEEASQIKQVEMARAPLPGAARKITRDWIRARLACAGFDMKTVTIKAPLNVMLVSESQTVKGADITEKARQCCLGQLPKSDINYTLVPIDNTSDAVVPSGKLELVAEPSDRAVAPGRQQVCIDVLVDGSIYTKKSVNLNLTATGPVLVATQSIRSKEPLTSSNTKIEQREITTLPQERWARFRTTPKSRTVRSARARLS